MMNTTPTVSPKKTTAANRKKLAALAGQLSSPAGRENTHQQFQNAARNRVLRRGTPPVALKALAAAGRTVLINIRLAAADMQQAHELANEKGVGYQTVIEMLLHEALKDKKTHKAW